MRGHCRASPRARGLMGGRVPVFPTWPEERQLRLHQALHTVPRSPVGTRRGQCHTAGECGVPGDQAVRWRRGTAQAPHLGEQSGLWTSRAEVVQSPSRCPRDPGRPGAPVRTGVTKPGSVGRSTPGFAGFGLGGRQSQRTKAVHVGSDTRAQNWGVRGKSRGRPARTPSHSARDAGPTTGSAFAKRCSAAFPSQ